MNRLKTNALAIALVCFGLLIAAACNGTGPGSSPTASFKGLFEATRNKDAAGIKRRLSKGTLAMMETIAQKQNKKLDDMLTTSMNDSANNSAKIPETRNEKITGDTATLEVKDEKSGKWQPIPFVKEDGEWKFAMDKLVREAFQHAGTQMNLNAQSDAGASTNSNK